ncbi:predicted protein [Methanosarcina acetivorans C2A]|uniref:Uncharacterized protein n=2 Tax=Methanosarcina acetivorans TaxID=2214 RepID=Q8TTD2_METAC|nr:predicted protein [Methanosarcina acetivorans C2A]
MRKLIRSTWCRMTASVTLSVILILLAPSVSLAGTGDDSDASSPEVGVEWVNDYTWPYSDLSYCDDSANGLYNRLGNEGWTKSFNKGNSNAKAAHFEQANQDSQYIDAVDIALYSGHGSTDKLDVSTVTEKVYHDEAEWGDYDLEWIGLDCCLAGSGDFSSSLNGAHLILGFSTNCYDSDLGLHWANYLVDDGSNDVAYTVKNSWFYGADVDQPSGVTAKVFGETSSCGNDYIWGQGSVITDPPVDSSYTYWTYNMG